MNLWEKLTYDPEMGPRIRAPLPSGLFGAVLMFTTLLSIVDDSIQVGKGPGAEHIHFEDHPITFLLSSGMFFTLACGFLWFARRQYLKNCKD